MNRTFIAHCFHTLPYRTNCIGTEENKRRLRQDNVNRPTLAICIHSNAYSQGLQSVLTAMHTAKA